MSPRESDPVDVFLDDGTHPSGCAEYDALPRGVKDLHPYEGWQWLSSDQKAALTQSETEPDY